MSNEAQLLTMQRPAPGVLVTPGGVPIVPTAVQERLAAFSTQIRRELRIEWIAGAHKPYFGLKVRWRSEDPRWEHVRSGQTPADMAFDLECMFPPDCTGEQMVSYLEGKWGERNALDPRTAAKEAERIVNASVRQHQDAREAQVDAVVEQGQERFLSESAHLRNVRAGAEKAHPMVPGGLST